MEECESLVANTSQVRVDEKQSQAKTCFGAFGMMQERPLAHGEMGSQLQGFLKRTTHRASQPVNFSIFKMAPSPTGRKRSEWNR